jgi:Xaa-Pro aminopeptidase
LIELEEKTGRIVEMLSREELGGVLLNAQHNFSWITGGASNGIDLSRENGAASIFVRSDGKRFLLANNIEMPRMLAEEVSADDFEPVGYSWQDEKSSPDFLIAKAQSLTDSEVATDIAIHSSARSIEGLMGKCRAVLTPDEVVRYKALGNDAGRAMRAVFDKISPDETEIQIAAKMRDELAAHEIQSVVTLVATDDRLEKFRHPVPTKNRWNRTLMLVTCAKRGGLITSLSRIACAGKVPEELVAKTEAAAFVNAALWDATVAGATGAELYRVASETYSKCGFADEINKHHQGGATGYRTRDWVAHPRSADVVHTAQAFAWNPSITGTKVEETVIITTSGIETITTSPDFPAIVTTINGREYSSPGILNIH